MLSGCTCLPAPAILPHGVRGCAHPVPSNQSYVKLSSEITESIWARSARCFQLQTIQAPPNEAAVLKGVPRKGRKETGIGKCRNAGPWFVDKNVKCVRGTGTISNFVRVFGVRGISEQGTRFDCRKSKPKPAALERRRAVSAP